jgi:hypothetical protein
MATIYQQAVIDAWAALVHEIECLVLTPTEQQAIDECVHFMDNALTGLGIYKQES